MDKKKNVHLKKCPWCGRIPEIAEAGTGNSKTYSVMCTGYSTCPVSPSTNWCRSSCKAVQAWNERR